VPTPKLAHEALTSEVIGAFFDVYNELKYGLLESLYRAALEIVLAERGLCVQREAPLEVRFHGQRIGFFRADMIVNDVLIVEVKAGAILPVGSKPQLINYLRISTLEVGLLLFFGRTPEFQRVVRSGSRIEED
jgi:GxxExxY protein